MKFKFFIFVSLLVVVSAIGVLAWPGDYIKAENLNFVDGDSFLKLGKTGYASRPNSQAVDLDYSKSFSVEALIKIEPQKTYGHFAYLFGKGSGNTGISLNLYWGNYPTYGQAINGSVGDGATKLQVSSYGQTYSFIEGYVYAVLAWDVENKTLALYLNGQPVSSVTNTAIIPSKIKNTSPMVLGESSSYQYGGLDADLFFARLWNRKITAGEVQAIWNNYQNTGQHLLPSSVPVTGLLSQWLCDQTSDASGMAGATYIKDSAGANHLELLNGAIIRRQSGPLLAVAPLDGSVEVDKSVYLTAQGGQSTLGANAVLPLRYFFEVDESASFNSSALKQSGWQTHYSGWSPILKPNTHYYWRARVRDSANTPKESSWIPTQGFQTQGPSVWYVRPRNESAKYGREDGASYENAFNGLGDWNGYSGEIPTIIWGPGGVEAGDTLFVCDTHTKDNYYLGFLIKASGFSQEYPITIRGDYNGHQGIINSQASEKGYYLTIQRKKFLLFKNLSFQYFGMQSDGLNTINGAPANLTDDPKSTDITFEGCTFDNIDCSGIESFFGLFTGNDRWTFLNNTFTNGINGIYTSTYNDLTGGGANYLTLKNNIFKHMAGGNSDSHAIGIQGGQGHLIEGNYIEDTGAAIAFWADSVPMGNMTVRGNFIKDAHKDNNSGWHAEGSGIIIADNYNGDQNTTRNWDIDHNIILNTAGAGFYLTTRENVALKISNNIIMNTGGGSYDGVGIQAFAWGGGAVAGEIYNNIIVNPFGTFIGADDPLKIDYNLYFSADGAPKKFQNHSSFADYRQAHPNLDAHGIYADPQFTAAVPQLANDFILKSTSPAINTGFSWGQTTDYFGNLIQGVPDIGPIEYQLASSPPPAAPPPATPPSPNSVSSSNNTAGSSGNSGSSSGGSSGSSGGGGIGGGTMATISTTTSLTDTQLLAEVNRITALIAQLQAQLLIVSGGSASDIGEIPQGFLFFRSMKFGTVGQDIQYLQIVLNQDPDTRVAASGVGSSGQETIFFGRATVAAVIKFQEKYKAEVLIPLGRTKGTGKAANKTIEKLNQILISALR